MFVNARAVIERETPGGPEIVVQIRNKPAEGGKWIELPGGRVEEFESLIGALKREVQEETGLKVVQIEGLGKRVEAQSAGAKVECLLPFAVYQTLQGPVDSMGVYFRCQVTGEPVPVGDDTQGIQWVPVRRLAQWLRDDGERFSWVDRPGLVFYLQSLKEESSNARSESSQGCRSDR